MTRLSYRDGEIESVCEIGARVPATLPGALAGRPAVVVADRRPWRKQGGADGIFGASLPGKTPVRLLSGGEGIKDLDGLADLYRLLAKAELPRDGVVIGLGGGTVLDLAGLAAATWKRGVAFIAVPTTLLADVDAAIGGKTAINLESAKNVVGTFHPAERILIDPANLRTLPRREWRNGMAELIKTAVIGDPDLFASLETRRDELRAALSGRADRVAPRMPELPLADWITAAVKVKLDIVAADPREAGPRRALNLGHTLGHALELSHGLAHGQAVALGLASVARVAAAHDLCSGRTARRIVDLLADCGLPVTLKIGDRRRVERLLAADKKRLGSRVGWVLPRRLGEVSLDQAVDAREAIASLGD